MDERDSGGESHEKQDAGEEADSTAPWAEGLWESLVEANKNATASHLLMKISVSLLRRNGFQLPLYCAAFENEGHVSAVQYYANETSEIQLRVLAWGPDLAAKYPVNLIVLEEKGSKVARAVIDSPGSAARYVVWDEEPSEKRSTV